MGPETKRKKMLRLRRGFLGGKNIGRFERPVWPINLFFVRLLVSFSRWWWLMVKGIHIRLCLLLSNGGDNPERRQNRKRSSLTTKAQAPFYGQPVMVTVVDVLRRESLVFFINIPSQVLVIKDESRESLPTCQSNKD